MTQHGRPLTAPEQVLVTKWLDDHIHWIKELSLAAVLWEMEIDFKDLEEACGEAILTAAIESWASANSVTFPKKSKTGHWADTDFTSAGQSLLSTGRLLSTGFQLTPFDTQLVFSGKGLSLRPLTGNAAIPRLSYTLDGVAKADLSLGKNDNIRGSYDPAKEKVGLGGSYKKGKIWGASLDATYDFKKDIAGLKLKANYSNFHLEAAVSNSSYGVSLLFPNAKKAPLNQRTMQATVAEIEMAASDILAKARAHGDPVGDPVGFSKLVSEDLTKLKTSVNRVNSAIDYYKKRTGVSYSGSIDMRVGDFEMPAYGTQVGPPAKIESGFFIGATFIMTFN